MGKMKLKELFIDIKTMLERWDGIPGLLGRKRMISRLEEAILEL